MVCSAVGSLNEYHITVGVQRLALWKIIWLSNGTLGLFNNLKLCFLEREGRKKDLPISLMCSCSFSLEPTSRKSAIAFSI